MISTRQLDALPGIVELRRALQAMAMLDAILCPEWELRMYSFNAHWDEGEQMASMRNGAGDDFYAHFSAAGCWLKGFSHECAMSPYRQDPLRVWPGVLDSVPKEFAACVSEPAFTLDDTTFCIWRRVSDAAWQTGEIEFPRYEDPDGSEELLSNLDGLPSTYQAYAAEYFERDVDLDAVTQVYSHQPLTAKLLAALNPELALSDLEEDLAEIGYPSA